MTTFFFLLNVSFVSWLLTAAKVYYMSESSIPNCESPLWENTGILILVMGGKSLWYVVLFEEHDSV